MKKRALRKKSAKHTGRRLSFFFNKVIRLSKDEHDYCEECATAALRQIRILQRRLDSESFREFDLVGGLASYVVFLRHICARKRIRYSAILHIAGNMTAYMGHETVLEVICREDVPLDKLKWSWSGLSPLTSAIVGHQDALARKLLERFPKLVDQPCWHDAVAICVKYGTLNMLRTLHSHGVNLDRKYMTARRGNKSARPLGSPFYYAVACNKPLMQKELLRLGAVSVIGEGAPDTWLRGEGRTLFEVATKRKNFAVADMCLEKGVGPVFGGDEDVYVLNRTGASTDMEIFAYFENRFPEHDFVKVVRDSLSGSGCTEWFSEDVLAHCRITVEKKEEEPKVSYDPYNVPDHIRSFFLALEIWPELIVPWCQKKPWLVRLMFAARGLNSFPRYASSLVPVFRFAKQHKLELWGHWEQQGEFMDHLDWNERRHLAPHVAEFGFPKLQLLKSYEYPSHPSYLGDEWDERQWKAASAKGKTATRYLDDARFVLRHNVSLVGTFAGFLSEHADWNLYQKWIMRGMPPYPGTDEPWDYPMINYVNAGLLKHLVRELGMLPGLHGRDGVLAMWVAIQRHDLKLVKSLLELGVGINARVAGYASPLRESILVGADEIANSLHQKGGQNIDPDGRKFPIPPWVANRRVAQ